MTEALKPRPMPEIMAELQAAVDEASLRYGYIADTIRVNAMRHGATSEQIEAFVHGRASFVDWLANTIEVRRLSDALAIPEVAALVEAAKAARAHIKDFIDDDTGVLPLEMAMEGIDAAVSKIEEGRG